MDSVKDLGAVIGLYGRHRSAAGLRVDVTLDDARKAYGRIDYRVSPLGGEGCVWVASDRVELESKA
jgi:hypothetical protein